jgi:hypothetical protein
MTKYNAGDLVKVYNGDDFLSIGTGTVEEAIKEGYYAVLFPDGSRQACQVANLRRAYTHISPSALFVFLKNPVEFYMAYMSRYRAPRLSQTQPMSIGSAFDAYVKSYIIKALAKGNAVDPKYEFKNLFAAQVEEHNRDWAWSAGNYAFDAYKASGALADLMLEMAQGDKDPRFEFDMKGFIKSDEYEVPLGGKPDLEFTNKHKAVVVSDWKVNGFCSRSAAGPKPGYIRCRDGWNHHVAPPSRNNRSHHKDAQVQTIQGIEVNVAVTLEMIDKDWATQLCTYAWLLGHPVGSPFIAAIEQLACAPGKEQDKPLIRVASFRNFISKTFQMEVFNQYKKCWECLKTGYLFTDVSRSESDLKCMELEKLAKTLQPTGDTNEDWFRNMDRIR